MNKNMKCPICGVGFLENILTDYYTFVKDGNHEIRLTVNRLKRQECSHCKEEFLNNDAVNRIQLEKYKVLDLLTPDELKMIREKLGLTQEEMSDLLAVGKKSYFRWENGLSIQNKSIDRYIRLVNQNPINISILRDIQKVNNPFIYDKEKVQTYFISLQSIETQNESLIGCVGHEAEITKEQIGQVEKIIQNHLQRGK